MSGYQASCPSCGASVVFNLGASLLRICDHCGSAVVRKGANVETYGKVAELIPTPSVLQLGAEGTYAGAPPFTLVGRLQLDHGAGTWDEWLMAFGDETWAWLSESQGKFHYLGRTKLPPVPEFGELQPGATVDLGPPGVFVVAEVRAARFVTGQGELPFDVEPGSELHYADLSGPGKQFATLDYGTGNTAEALYVGREVSLEQMGFRNLPSEEERRKKDRGGSLSCPQCGGPLELRAPDKASRVACPYCGSLLDATKDLAVLEAMNSVPVKPIIPLGSKGRLGGVPWTVIGFMERSTTYEGIRYPWREYLLYEPRRGFRWLVEADGHWTYVESANVADVRGGGGSSSAAYGEKTYKHFQTAQAKVDHVLGEFYWAVARGDTVQASDYVSPPHALSKEADGKELHWSHATYKAPEEIWKAFGVPGSPPRPAGVAPAQPSPYGAAARSAFKSGLLFVGIIFLLFMGFLFSGGRKLHSETFVIAPDAKPGAPESAVFSKSFDIKRQGNLQLRLEAPVSNSWLYLDGALIEEKSGDVYAFDTEISYYYGRSGGESWSEGSTRSKRYVGSVPPGQYVLRLAPQWDKRKRPSQFKVTVKGNVARFHHVVLAGMALMAWPMLLGWRSFRFEAERWSESDHPWSSEE